MYLRILLMSLFTATACTQHVLEAQDAGGKALRTEAPKARELGSSPADAAAKTAITAASPPSDAAGHSAAIAALQKRDAGATDASPPPGTSNPSWTSSATRSTSASGEVSLLRPLRTAPHAEYDRVVFELEGKRPGHEISFLESPPRHCASDHPVAVRGGAWLQIQLSPAQAHDEAGHVTVGKIRRTPELPRLRELVQTCDFEAQVIWVLGLSEKAPYRVLELDDPLRLVIDVQR